MEPTSGGSGTVATEQPAVAPQRSWKQRIIQIVMFQLVIRFFFKSLPQAKDPTTGELIPPLHNAFTPGLIYDLFVYVSDDPSASLQDFAGQEPIWFLDSQAYSYNRKEADRIPVTVPLQYIPANDVYDQIISQHLLDVSDEELGIDITAKSDSIIGAFTDTTGRMRKHALQKRWKFLYLHVFAVLHSTYPDNVAVPLNALEAAEAIKLINYDAEDLVIVRGNCPLIEYMKPIGDKGLQSLLGEKEQAPEEIILKDEKEEPHWKNHIDIRMIVDSTPLTPQALTAPHLRYIKVMPERGLYQPILTPSDLWLLERNFIHLNDTLKDVSMNLTLTFNSLNMMWWTIRSQLSDVWNPTEGSITNPLSAFQSNSKRERFMIKISICAIYLQRIVLDTNPYLLAFSGAFMLLHTAFSMLAFKNEIQFWHRNDSMQGLSALSILSSFICELIIALYLYDSEETSFLILFEIFFGVAISAWKVTKAVKVNISWKTGVLPTLEFGDKKDYDESDTKKYDRVAIKFMSLLLLPCMIGYAIYALKYKKYKSWYSYVVSTLAGTVYTFGFVMMTPQLYINYKLKSVDHLPWRAFTYKALNTFVDDIAAFIIDMPWMHRLACFRDDVIFVCYLYQRWVYSVDKTRPSEWVDPSTLQNAVEHTQPSIEQQNEASTLWLGEGQTKKPVAATVKQRRGGEQENEISNEISNTEDVKDEKKGN